MSVERGAAPVARLETLPPFEAWLICAMRLWQAEEEGRNHVIADMQGRMGASARNAARLMEEFMDMLGTHVRRPIMYHGLNCACVGADEAVVANFVSCATDGAREDAMLIATLLVRPDIAPLAVSLAQQLGLALRRRGDRRVLH